MPLTFSREVLGETRVRARAARCHSRVGGNFGGRFGGGTVGSVARKSAAFGLDLRPHMARRLDVGMVARADMVIGMERSHVREVVLADPPAFSKSFTLREIVRRGAERGGRNSLQSLPEWLTYLGEGRRHLDLIGDSPRDDILDPMGGKPKEYRVMLNDLEALTQALHSLTWPRSG